MFGSDLHQHLAVSSLLVQGGFPITSIREIRILRTLTHDNIVELLEVVTDSHGKVEDGKVWGQCLHTVQFGTFNRCAGRPSGRGGTLNTNQSSDWEFKPLRVWMFSSSQWVSEEK